MKEDELREHAVCSICKNKIGDAILPSFWTLYVERHALDLKALGRLQGLTMFLGGSAALASVMGENEDLSHSVLKKHLTLCELCASNLFNIDDQVSNAIFSEEEKTNEGD